MDEARPGTQEQRITGTVRSVIFQNEENGYTVLRLDVGTKDGIVVTGCLPFSAPGEELTLDGVWERHPAHGDQFRATAAKRSMPSGDRNIYEYLASGVIRGIGPATAGVLVTRFGSRTLEVIESSPEKLSEIRGISLGKARKISEAFRRQNSVRLLMEFLTANGLKAEYAMRLYKVYGNEASDMLRANPYILSTDRIGGQFDEADALAISLGFEEDSPQRIAAALIYEMVYNLGNGHSFLPREKLIAATAQLIGVESENTEECLDVLLDEGEVVQQPVANVVGVYLHRLYEAESGTARRLLRMAKIKDPLPGGTRAAVDRLEREFGMQYAPMQRTAIELAAERRLLAVTGGPGTGKTTIIRAILGLMTNAGVECILAAPTGRAAKRMTELTGQEAYTVHRLLGASWDGEGDTVSFRKNEDDRLRCGAVILDECSMVDIVLIHALLRAMPEDCRLILVGDADQLPSVGPGCFFLDVLRSGAVATVRLTEVFRQSGQSHIVRNAHAINRGETPDLKENKGDFFFLQRFTGDKIASTVEELCRERLPNNMGIRPEDIQVLTPTRRGESGTGALNARLQNALNPPSPAKKEKKYGEITFREGDRVMQIRNNYDIVWFRGADLDDLLSGREAPETGSGIFNGDLGVLRKIDPESELLWVSFDDRLAWYGFDQLHELEHAFAVTVHKSQGSEYRAVILAAGRTPPRLISRDLLYTGVTRAKELLVLVGDKAVVQAMIDNGRKTRRYSGLRARLAGEVPS